MTPSLPDLAQAWVDAETKLANMWMPDNRTYKLVADAKAAFLTACATAARETAELRAEVERLRLERDSARSQFDNHVAWASDQDLALRAEAAKVLRPFAEIAKVYPIDTSKDSRDVLVLVMFCHAAAALIAKLDAGEAGRTDDKATEWRPGYTDVDSKQQRSIEDIPSLSAVVLDHFMPISTFANGIEAAALAWLSLR